MPTLKQIFWTLMAGVAVSVIGTIIGFLSAARLEISFDKLKDFEVTDLKSYKTLGTSVKFDLELSDPREFVAFWGEDDKGKTVYRRIDVHFKNFKLANRIEGDITDHTESGDVVYKITGYYNSNHVVFSHRGPQTGVGIYILDEFQVTNVAGAVFSGYTIFEDVPIEGMKTTRLSQCPFVMIETLGTVRPYSTVDDAQKAFSSLRTECTEFKLPESS
jgi:hypothetical protein